MPIFEKLGSYGSLSQKEKEDSLIRTTEDLFFRNLPFSKICSIPPRLVMDNVAFVVDTSKLASFDDIVADDCGSWRNNGQHKFKFKREDDSLKRLASNSPDVPDVYLHRTYYVNKNAKDFRKMVSFVLGNSNF